MRHLEALGVHVFNPVKSIEISRDKLYTHQIMVRYHQSSYQTLVMV
jgi:glutathione synthase/RimK-type ligase-like ATP-grasp enzyme